VKRTAPLRVPRPLLLATAAALVAGCGAPEVASGETSSSSGRSALPFAHIHGVGVDPGDGTILVATHEGLFEVDGQGEADRVSPVMDLMGFAVVGTGHFVASGHPGPDVDLPQPVGLIESTDAGRTWRPLSRQGESDFHALTTGDVGFLGFDGSLLRSSDGTDWTALQIPLPPAALAASPETPDVLATTQGGVIRSTDAGESWESLREAPVLQFVAWAAARTVVGVDPGGAVWTSRDGGNSWAEGPRLGAPPQALAAGSAGPAGQRIVVATTAAVLASDDDGRTFDAVVEG
jgi:photosystem II stability/assembly factor-like uncharacterized protein